MTSGVAGQRPTYVGIGAQKCASTWLHRILESHPEVSVPEVKEADFFSYRYDRGFQWYERCFATAQESGRVVRARGEISPSYFCEPAVPERIARYMPGAKIMVSLRDPVERALSNHRHDVKERHLTGDDLSFERGLSNNPMYVEQGLYATHLKRWLRYFPRDQVLVVLMDDIEADPGSVCRTVYRFLGVDESFLPQGFDARHNGSYATRSAALTKLKDKAYATTRLPALRWAWEVAADSGLKTLYHSLNVVPSEAVIPPPQPQTLAQLRHRFEPEIRELETLLDRTLSPWLRQH
ncbi:MAG: sulfotransferase [Steroidobacteraceae bacterium]|nr:sulfotransferase [Steroidobacteraceae bacterium]